MNTILTVLLLQSGGSPWENAVQQLQNVPHTLPNEIGAALVMMREWISAAMGKRRECIRKFNIARRRMMSGWHIPLSAKELQSSVRVIGCHRKRTRSIDHLEKRPHLAPRAYC
jgi:hypothetical protein